MFVDFNRSYSFFSSNLISPSEPETAHQEDKYALSFLLNPEDSSRVVEEKTESTQDFSKSSWSEQEISLLRTAVKIHGTGNWRHISNCIKRPQTECKATWERSFDPDRIGRFWAGNEDDVLRRLVNIYGEKAWVKVALLMPGRTNRQCKIRWRMLQSNAFKAIQHWSPDEDKILLRNQSYLSWAEIAGLIPGRTAKQCEKRFEFLDSGGRGATLRKNSFKKQGWISVYEPQKKQGSFINP